MTRHAAELDAYEVAYLAGGPARMVDTAVVALVRSGRLRVHSPGELATVDLTRRHPVEAAVLDAVGPSGHRSVDTIRWRVASDDRILDVGRALQREGLLGRSLLRRGRPASSPTAAGRRVLAQLRAERAAGADEWRVALDGRQAMPDQALRASIFEHPRTAVLVSRRSLRKQRRQELAADPGVAAARTHLAAFGGGAAISLGGDGGLGDGGGGGGDGGGF